MEDLPEVQPALTSTKAKYLEAINDLSRVVLPSFVESNYNIHYCKTSELEALATELGLAVDWWNGWCTLEINNPKYRLTLYGRAFE